MTVEAGRHNSTTRLLVPVDVEIHYAFFFNPAVGWDGEVGIAVTPRGPAESIPPTSERQGANG